MTDDLENIKARQAERRNAPPVSFNNEIDARRVSQVAQDLNLAISLLEQERERARHNALRRREHCLSCHGDDEMDTEDRCCALLDEKEYVIEIEREARKQLVQDVVDAEAELAALREAAQPLMDELERLVDRGELAGDVLGHAQAFDALLTEQKEADE